MQCKYHPLSPAANRCSYCELSFCETCSDESLALRSRDRQGAQCFVCSNPLSPSVAAQSIEPFWNRISDIYRYPVSVESLSAIIVLALLSAMFKGMLIPYLLPSIGLMMYTFACLRQTAGGDMKAPGLDACFEGSVFPVIFIGLLSVAFLFGLGFLAAGFGQGFMIFLSVLLVCVFPAIIILISVNESVISALNPVDWVGVVTSTGAGYFVMLLFVLMMSSSMAIPQAFMGDPRESFVSAFFIAAIGNYYTVVIFHIMGYLVYQHHDELGFTADNGAEATQRSTDKLTEAKLNVLIMEGEYDQARDFAIKKAKAGGTLWDWSKAFKLACIGKLNTKAGPFFLEYIDKLDAAGETDQIASAYLGLIKHDPNYLIENLPKRLAVADALFDIGKYPHTIKLLNGFHEQSNDHKLIADALKLRGDSFAKIPGREKHAEHYLTLHELALKKAQRMQP